MESNSNNYIGFVIHYGIWPVLLLLAHYEDLGEFEECKKIIVALNVLQRKMKVQVPTQIKPEDYKKLLESEDGFEELRKYQERSKMILEEVKSMS